MVRIVALFLLLTASLLTAPRLPGQNLVARLVPSGNPTFANFGSELSLSGEMLLVGANQTAVQGKNYAGAAHVFRRSNGVWREETRLTLPSPEIHDNFGAGVALNGDLAVVGAPDFPVSSFSGTGNVYVYRQRQGSWQLETRLNGSDAGHDSAFGHEVATDGSTIVVAARRKGMDKVYFFERVAGSWTQVGSFPAFGVYTRFGHALQVDGDTAIVGAEWEAVGANTQAGAVHVYRRRAGGSWSLEATLTDPKPEDLTLFGAAVCLAGDTLAVGAPQDRNQAGVPGSVFVFQRNGANWGTAVRLDAPVWSASTRFRFGHRLALDQGLLLVGAPGTGFAGAASGSVFPFRRRGSSWVSEAPFIPAQVAQDWGFGTELALQGSRAVISGYDPSAEGVAFVYDVTDDYGGCQLGHDPSPAEAGEDLKLTLTGARLREATVLAVGSAGSQPWLFAPLGVVLRLDRPQVLLATVTDGAGELDWQVPLSSSTVGIRVWVQAVQSQQASHPIVIQVVDPT